MINYDELARAMLAKTGLAWGAVYSRGELPDVLATAGYPISFGRLAQLAGSHRDDVPFHNRGRGGYCGRGFGKAFYTLGPTLAALLRVRLQPGTKASKEKPRAA